MPKHKKQTWDERLKLLEYLVSHTIRDAAKHYGVTEDAINGRLFTLRKDIATTQTALNRIRTLQRQFPRIRKLTTSGEIPEDLIDEKPTAEDF